jgi:hypothetical protein
MNNVETVAVPSAFRRAPGSSVEEGEHQLKPATIQQTAGAEAAHRLSDRAGGLVGRSTFPQTGLLQTNGSTEAGDRPGRMPSARRVTRATHSDRSCAGAGAGGRREYIDVTVQGTLRRRYGDRCRTTGVSITAGAVT